MRKETEIQRRLRLARKKPLNDSKGQVLQPRKVSNKELILSKRFTTLHKQQLLFCRGVKESHEAFLNDWEKKFKSTLEDVVEKYGEKALISEKQEKALKKLSLKLTNEIILLKGK